MDWRIKGIVQKSLSLLPGGQRINNALQSRLGGLRNFDANVDAKVVADWLVLVDHLRVLGVPMAGRTFMEIGTGWFPTLPVCFSLAGVSKCVTYDVSRLMDWRLTQRMVQGLSRHLPRIATELQLPESELRARWQRLADASSLDELLRRTGIEYRSPADATRSGLPNGSVDVVFSNSVLEHVEAAAIEALMRETRRILRPGGHAVHSVNCGDHYAYFDRSVTQIHYLRYSETQWRLWNNSVQYQNRLRADDFLHLAQQQGLGIVLNRQKPRAELISRFEEFPIAPQFRRYSREQLCTTSVDFVAQAPG